MPEEIVVEDENPNPASTPGLVKMADKWDALVRANPQAIEAAKADAGKVADKPATTAAEVAAAAKAAEAAKAATIKPEDDENYVPPSIKSPKAAEDFRLIKKRALAAEAKAAEHERAIAAKTKEYEDRLKAAPKADPKELEAIKAEADKYKSLVETIGVEFDPAFQAKYEKRAEAVIEQLKLVIPEATLKKLGELLPLPDGPHKQQQLAEITEGLDDLQKLELFQANRDFRAIANERNAELSQSRQKFAELQKGKQAETDKLKERLGKAFDAATERVRDKEKGMFLFQPKDGDEAWNKAADERVTLARHIYDGNFQTDDERADAAFWAASAPAILQDALATKNELAEVTERLQKISGAAPKIKDAGKGAEEVKTPTSFSDRVTAGLAGRK